MTGLALYRLPHEQQVTMVAQTEDEPQELLSCEPLNDQSGFVVAPFSVSEQCPIVLIRPDVVQVFPSHEECSLTGNKEFPRREQGVPTVGTTSFHGGNSCRTDYAADFARFYDSLKNGIFRKLVLSRCVEEPVDNDVSPLELFQCACRMYPRLFVSLVYTPKSGLWLTATPEILLEGVGDEWRTIALAGTMKLEGEDLQGEGEHITWSTKNIQEQRYVATYLMECLERYATDIHEEGPRTVRAANLVHLRSDFSFHIYNKVRVGELLQALHPTPAVCGLPKEKACRFIHENEHTPRLYYSGFMGPMDMGASTNIYVSLRCMQITQDHYRLYAGGGLLKDSTEEQEWQETEAKLETMRRCIATRRM